MNLSMRLLMSGMLLMHNPVMANWMEGCTELQPMLPSACTTIQARVAELAQFAPPAPMFVTSLSAPTPINTSIPSGASDLAPTISTPVSTSGTWNN